MTWRSEVFINYDICFAWLTTRRYTDVELEPANRDLTYAKPYTRIPTYLVGMVMGYILFKLKGKKVKIPPVIIFVCI